jgi:hypothetical protein
MNYFLSGLFRDKGLWALVPIAILAGLNLADFLFSLAGRSPFRLWVIRGTLIAAATAAIVAGVRLHGKRRKDRRLDEILPGFLEERRAWLSARAAGDPGFNTFCHECRHFDLGRLACRLVLRERKARILLSDDNPVRHCLYWNLAEDHPVMRLTGRIPARDAAPAAASGEAPGGGRPG